MSLSRLCAWVCLITCCLIGSASLIGADEPDPLSPYVVDGLWCPSEIMVWAGYSCGCAYNDQCPKLRLRVADGDQDLAGGWRPATLRENPWGQVPLPVHSAGDSLRGVPRGHVGSMRPRA